MHYIQKQNLHLECLEPEIDSEQRDRGYSQGMNQGSFEQLIRAFSEEIVKGFFESDFWINALATFKEVESSKSIERMIIEGFSSVRNIKVIKEMIKFSRIQRNQINLYIFFTSIT